jgi:cold shock CspA family protein
MSAAGTVRSWNPGEGWGVVDVDQVDGGVWVHFSAIEGRPSGHLDVGESVLVDWEAVSHPPCAAQATRVIVDGSGSSTHEEPRPGAMHSTLTFEWDADPEK